MTVDQPRRPFSSPAAADREVRVLPLHRYEVRATGRMELQLLCRDCGELFYQITGDVSADVLVGAMRDHQGAVHLLQPPTPRR